MEIVNIDDPDSCWELYPVNKERPRFWLNNVAETAYRYSFKTVYEYFIEDLFVCHKCDNSNCVRPDHLFLGTQLDNMRDMIAKGRRRSALGESNSLHKLTNIKVLEIVKLKKEGVSYKELSNRYGVCAYCIQKIVYGKSWKHVTGIK